MEIQEKLLKFKFHILLALALTFLTIFICYLAPRFIDILKYFCPLLVSTSLFLVAAVVFDRISPPSAEYSGDNPAEGLLDYVAGDPLLTERVEYRLEDAEESVRSQ